MYHVVLFAITGTLLLGVWNLVHVAPRSIAMVLPPTVALIAGGALIVFGMFFALVSAMSIQHAPAMITFFIKALIGLWLITAHSREDEQTLRRAFFMMGLLMLTIIAIFYVQDPYAAAVLSMGLVAAGVCVFTGNVPFLDGGR